MENVDSQTFKKIIRMIESSDGKNVNHPKITRGIHAGDQAVGAHAIMPNTGKEFIKRDPSATEEEKQLLDLDNGTFRDRLEQNPDLQEKIVNNMTNFLLNKTKGDVEKAAFMYNMGHNRNPDSITPEMLQKADYVQKFNKLRSTLKPGM